MYLSKLVQSSFLHGIIASHSHNGKSPIVHLNFVNWEDNATARELRSAEEILIAQSNGELEIARTNILINSPAMQHR
jgi:hypothetical protein